MNPINAREPNMVALGEGASRNFGESADALKILFDLHPSPLWVVDPDDGSFLAVNDAARRLSGYGDDEFLSLTIRDLLDLPSTEIASHETGRFPVRSLRLKNGGSIFVEVTFQKLKHLDREAYLYVVNDVSERWIIKRALVEADRKYQSIFENAVEGIYQNNPQGKFLTVNPAFARMLGYATPAELCEAVQLDKDLYVCPNQRRIFRSVLARSDEARALEFEAYRKNGTRIWLCINVRVVRDTDGRVLYYEGTAEDVSRRKEAERRLKLANASLEKKAAELARSNADLQQFAYAASHDLQEPLRMVSSYLSLVAMRYRGKLDEDVDEFIDYAVDGAKRMKHLIDDLLTYSRVGSGELVNEPVATEEVLRLVTLHMGIALEEALVELTYDPLPKLPGVRSQIYHLFHNMIANSAKFKKSVGPVTVHVGVRRVGGFWQFSVADNGIGMEMEYSERIFRMFQRLHPKHAYPGTGVGLAICKKIVEAQGGKIWVVSRAGEGSTFYFTLPCGAEEIPSSAAPI